MNGQHLRAFLWLRWRLRINQLRRGGIANFVILTILAVAAVAAAVGLFGIFLSVGLFGFNEDSSEGLMYLFDGAVIAFLLLWMSGLITELQRSEPLSLEKFLHLPVSLTSAFLINYLSSLPSVSMLWFLSAMLGLNIGLIISRGAAMLLLLPMLAAFLLMVTALTYQFQGWLATLMANPRRRRTIIVAATMIFILLCQAPQLVNLANIRRHSQEQSVEAGRIQENVQKQRELVRDLNDKKISLKEFQKRLKELDGELHAPSEKANEEPRHEMQDTIRLMNLILPPGWLAAGAEAVVEGRTWPIVLAILGPALIATASLWRAYRTTLRLYTGQFTSGRTTIQAARSIRESGRQPAPTLRAGSTRTNPLEKNLPWLSEQVTVIALAAFRSLLRAPEAKMFLLTPLLMLFVLAPAFMVGMGRADVPEMIGPLLAFGAMVMILFGMSQLLGNQFGFDRDGFRVFVLSPARRRDILLGKNLAVAPFVLALGTAAVVVVQVFYPMRLDHILALVPRFVSMYLIYCLPANLLSILAPMRIAAGSFQPTRPRGIVILSQLFFMFLCPPVLALTLLPLGIEWAAEAMGWRYGVPIDLIFSVLECAIVVCLYVLLLRFQGDWLQAREQRILQMVTTRAN